MRLNADRRLLRRGFHFSSLARRAERSGELSRPAGALHLPVRARSRHRSHRAHHSPEAHREVRTAVPGGQPHGRGRRDRRRYRRESAARRLHHRPHLGLQFGRGGDESRSAVRHAEGPAGRLPGDLALLRPLHSPVDAVQDDQGADRLRQGQSLEAQLRQLRQLHAAAFLRRALQSHGRREDRARAVQGHRRRDPRDARRARCRSASGR